MKRIVSITVLMAGVALLSACPKKPMVVQRPSGGTQVPQSSGKNSSQGASTTTPLGGQAGAGGADGMGGAAGGALANKVIYFDFDKSDIKPEFADLIAAHARHLTSKSALRVKIEGNTDERGTREYNIGLGERRAQAVRRAFLLLGVAENQLTTVSFGAERPAMEGDDEAAWAKNRRVELDYLQ